jgi:hypothetical protein
MTHSFQLSDQLGQLTQLSTSLGQPAASRPARGPGRCTAACIISWSLHQRHAHHGSPLMQSRILDVTARARSAGHLADWQREGDIVVGWIDKLKAQGRATAPGALEAFLSVQWTKECKRQQARNKPAITAAETAGTNPVQQWFPPDDNETASRSRSSKGPIGLIIDLHSQWHDEALRVTNFITSMSASIIIPSGPPPAVYIALGKPLSSNYTIPRRASVLDPSAETTVFHRSSSTSLGATKPSVSSRLLHTPVAQLDSYT